MDLTAQTDMAAAGPHTAAEIDAITLEVLRNALQSVAEEMGAVLKSTAYSPNIKERMDASCALFDASGQLIAQAEHVPVHLGSMLRALTSILAHTGPLADGDILLVNDPYIAGAHLPDITMVAPFYYDGALLGYVANRAHHADVGGMEPGSMPGRSSEIYQEGLIIPPVRLYSRGTLNPEIMAFVLSNVRTPEERQGDLNAMLAALRTGQNRLAELADRHGATRLVAGFGAILDYAERRMRHCLAALPDGLYAAEDALDDDGIDPEPVPVKVSIRIDGDNLTLDFTGSAPVRAGNINAVAPMTFSASCFALKVITDPTMPVNAGSFRPIQVIIPEDSFLNAKRPAPVCAGNTETTHRVADTIFKAAAAFAPDAVLAASQGTMNLLGIGGIDPRNGRPYTYIETIAGGEGGRPWGDGTDGVQCNMTNTMNTPIEALEIAYPLRVECYEMRPNSSGDGRHRGGLGVFRALRAVDHTARVSFSAERRKIPPYGLWDGMSGSCGQNYILAPGQPPECVPGKTTLDAGPDTIVVVATPGGGGWQAAEHRPETARRQDEEDEKVVSGGESGLPAALTRLVATP